MSSPLPATGAYYGLAAILRDQTWEFDWWKQEVDSTGGLACPIDGEPLSSPPATDAGAPVIRFCRYCGWRAPRDVISPQHGVKMGRTG
jgi:hypothetical protein